MKVYRTTEKYSGDPGDGSTFKTFIRLTDSEVEQLKGYDRVTHDILDSDDPLIAEMVDKADPWHPHTPAPGGRWVSAPVLILDLNWHRAIIGQRAGWDV